MAVAALLFVRAKFLHRCFIASASAFDFAPRSTFAMAAAARPPWASLLMRGLVAGAAVGAALLLVVSRHAGERERAGGSGGQ